MGLSWYVCRLLLPPDIILEESFFIEFSEYSIYPGKISHALKLPLRKIDKHPDIPLAAYIGPMSLPGHTAYLGWKAFIEEKAKTVRSSI